MRVITLILAAIAIFSTTAIAADDPLQTLTCAVQQTDEAACSPLVTIQAMAEAAEAKPALDFTPLDQMEQQGCCSWHNGVCGCSYTGRTLCCDGTTSPSCRC